jgi:ribosome biogenesis protein NSA1
MFRIHSVFAPPPQQSAQQLKKGDVLGQEFMKSTPTVVAWDGFEAELKASEEDKEDVWDGMQVSGEREEDSEESGDEREQKRSRK